MSKFKQKTVYVDAIQWFKDGDHPAVALPPLTPDNDSPQAHIHTPVGFMAVEPGDWIVTTADGEHYPCKPDVFASAYDPVENAA